MKEFIRILEKKERRIIGVMSGTSLDGVDIALVRCQGSGKAVQLDLEAFQTYPLPEAWRKRIQMAFASDTREVCQINFDLGNLFADQLSTFYREFKLQKSDIDAIGFHGQTIYHVHNHSTLQTGEADIIAQALETIVVSDFRTADIAAGGSGAPLVPYLDQALFQQKNRNIALQNIGGIGNITFLPGDVNKEILAFDTGPANAILNELTEIISQGQRSFDENGMFSRQGNIQTSVLNRLLTHAYFSSPPPKSTGRELFGRTYVSDCLAQFPELKPLDLLRTFISLITNSIHNACQSFLPQLDKLYISGGGAHHPLIMEELALLFGKEKVGKIDEISNISADSKEAVAFALLAHERLNNVPTNIPSVTGAKSQVTLGKISIPYR